MPEISGKAGSPGLEKIPPVFGLYFSGSKMLDPRDFPKAGTSPLRPFGIYLVFLFLFAFVSTLLIIIDIGVYPPLYITQFVVFLGGAILYEKRLAPKVKGSRAGTPWISVRTLGTRPLIVPLIVLTTVILGFGSNMLAALKVELFPPLEEIASSYQEQILEILLPEALGAQIAGAVAVALVAPFCEEYLFRRTILTEQLRHQGLLMAVGLNGLLFALMHLNPLTVLPLFFVGAFLAHLTIVARSIWPAIIAHIALNTANGVILPRLQDITAGPEDIGLPAILSALGIFGTLSALLWVFTIWAMKKTSPAPQERS